MSKHPRICVFATPQEAAKEIANEMSALIRSRDHVVLGLATGSTPLPLYAELIRLHREEGLSFRHVTTFNLDEYMGLQPDHQESYWTFMHQNLFDHIDILPSNVHLPSGVLSDDEIESHCLEYEKMIKDSGGIDYQILGIGRTGHIGFNEPGTPMNARTHRIHLDPVTREDASPAFGSLENVPTEAITMGCGTILDARQIILLAWGEKKSEIVQKAIQGEITDQISASYLQGHHNASFVLDELAASGLST